MTHTVILDTDIGYNTDADDALALAYLLLRPDCELLGVTTVGLRSDWRAGMAEAICAGLGRTDVPIVAGADRPMCRTQYWRENPVQRWPAEATPQPSRTYEPNRAVDWLRRTIRESPNEVTLITIGQFTNLAALLLVDPGIVDRLGRVVSMGGRLGYPPGRPEGECNVILDPVAAKVAFQRLGDVLTIVSIDPVRGKPLTAEMLHPMLAGDRFSAVRTAWRGWSNHKQTDRIGLADPATCAIALEPRLATYETGRIGVELYRHPLPEGEPFQNGELTGATTFDPDEHGPHRIVGDFEKAAMHEHLRAVFTAGHATNTGV